MRDRKCPENLTWILNAHLVLLPLHPRLVNCAPNPHCALQPKCNACKSLTMGKLTVGGEGVDANVHPGLSWWTRVASITTDHASLTEGPKLASTVENPTRPPICPFLTGRRLPWWPNAFAVWNRGRDGQEKHLREGPPYLDLHFCWFALRAGRASVA